MSEGAFPKGLPRGGGRGAKRVGVREENRPGPAREPADAIGLREKRNGVKREERHRSPRRHGRGPPPGEAADRLSRKLSPAAAG